MFFAGQQRDEEKRRKKANGEPIPVIPPKAAIVVICDISGRQLKKWTVKYAPGTFEVNYWSLKINGIRNGDLAGGKKMGVVVTELCEFLRGKLVIMAGPQGDFQSLRLSSNQFNVYDIQSYYFASSMKTVC